MNDMHKNLTFKENQLLQLIPLGSENAISSKELCIQLDVDVRTLSSMVNKLRKDNYLIVSNGKGYYYSNNPLQDFPRFITSQNKRTSEHQKVIKPFKQKLVELQEKERIKKGETLF